MLTKKQLLLVWIEFIGKIKKAKLTFGWVDSKGDLSLELDWWLSITAAICLQWFAVQRSSTLTKRDDDKPRCQRTAMSMNRDGGVVNFTRKEESRWQRYCCRTVRRSAMALLSMSARCRCGKGQATSWICKKWDCNNCISRDGLCRDARKHDNFFDI